MTKKIIAIFSTFILASALFAQQKSETIFIEAETFQFPADWTKGKHKQKTVLNAVDSSALPMTVIDVKTSGKFHVWASSPDFPADKPGSRTFSVIINDVVMPNPAGRHGKDDFYWEKLGEIDLVAGSQLIALKRLKSHPRCDAIFLSTDEKFDPNKNTARLRYKVEPTEIDVSYHTGFPEIVALSTFKGAKNISIKNNDIEIIFTEKKNTNGKTYFERSVKFLKSSKPFIPESFKDEVLVLTYSKDPKCSEKSYFVTWGASNAKASFNINGKDFSVPVAPTNPYAVGESKIYRPTQIKKLSANSCELFYEDGIIATLALKESGFEAFYNVKCKVQEEGYYSFAFLGFNTTEKNDFEALELPTLFQAKRTMQTPKMVSNNLTSQPLALINKKIGDKDFTYGVIADPKNLPFDWSRGNSSIYGFTIASPQNTLQTGIFQPILGSINSFKKSGETLAASWYLLSIDGDWTDALQLANEKIFDASEMREAYEVSFSDAILNIATYLKNENASGWAADLKGRYNIEAENTATHASPLSELSVAILTDDEEYYKRIALPTIEFTLSRAGSHFTPGKGSRGSWVSDESRKLNVPGMWAADYYLSINTLLGGANPWVKDLITDSKGAIRVKSDSSAWATYLGMYLASNDKKYLEDAKTACDVYLKKAFDDNDDFNEPDLGKFINVSLYPYWWHLVDMYEITKDAKYLKYAQLGAFGTLSSLWSYPSLPKENVTIHKGNMLTSVGSIWWKGKEYFRLGRAQTDAVINALKAVDSIDKSSLGGKAILPEKKVDPMKVSRIGLGIEQHTTYMHGTANSNNIVMPSWSAEMLKVYQYTKRDILMKYSRHSIIGRYSNFLGYYVRDFTDVMHNPNYPYEGPDITSFYYHHAPCHFGQSMDYLMTQIELASDNKIRFPYVRQQGYVWFVDRIFGLPGRIFDEIDVKPMLDKTAVRLNSVKASTLLGRSKNSIWAIILNDSASALDAEIMLDSTAKALKGAKIDEQITVYDASGKKLQNTFTFFGDKQIKIPPMGLIALKIPAEDFEVKKQIPQIEGASHIVKNDLPKDWGQLHIFRIRSPFGKDSIFAIFTGGMDKIADVEMTVHSHSNLKLTKKEYPFEFSIYPISMGDDVEVSFTVSEKSKEKFSTEKFKLGK